MVKQIFRKQNHSKIMQVLPLYFARPKSRQIWQETNLELITNSVNNSNREIMTKELTLQKYKDRFHLIGQ